MVGTVPAKFTQVQGYTSGNGQDRASKGFASAGVRRSDSRWKGEEEAAFPTGSSNVALNYAGTYKEGGLVVRPYTT